MNTTLARPPAPPTVADVRAVSAKLRANRSAEARLAGAIAALGALEPDDLRLIAEGLVPPPPADPLDAALAALQRLDRQTLARLVLDLAPPCACAFDPAAEALADPAMLLALGWDGADDATRHAFLASVKGGRRGRP